MNRACIVCAGVLLLAGSAAAQEGGKIIQKTTISLGTATPGGGFPLYGNAFAQVINEADPALSIQPRNTKGSNENIPLLEKGELDIALVAGEPSYRSLHGHRAAAHQFEDPDRDLFEPRHVRGARATARTGPFAISSASRSRSARAAPVFRSCRATCSTGSG